MYSNFDEQYEKYLEENEPEVIAEFEVEGSLVTLFGPVIRVHGFDSDLLAADGTWSEKDEDTGEYMPDWSLTWFWKDGDSPEEHVYYEQDGLMVSAYNLCNILGGVSFDDLTFEIVK